MIYILLKKIFIYLSPVNCSSFYFFILFLQAENRNKLL